MRLAIVISHPIQHFCPQFVSFAQKENVQLKVFFASMLGAKEYQDVNFGTSILWGNLQLDKFDHVFLNGEAVLQSGPDLDAANLEQELENFAPDLIFTYGYFQKFQRRACEWAYRNKVYIAYISDSEMRHHESRIKRFLKSIFLKKYFRKPDFFLTLGDANENYYSKHGVKSERIIRMHHPIDRIRYLEAYEKRDSLRGFVRAKYNIPAHEPVLCVVGKLVKWKNQAHIIEAMRLLEEKSVKLHLLIIGSGATENHLRAQAGRLIESKVHFTGFINIVDLPGYYAASDIYVHPASLEPHSVAISEAIMMGLPVIISNTCGSYGNTDDVQVGKNGYVYEFGNMNELANVIEKLLVNKFERKNFGEYSHVISKQFQERSHHLVLDDLEKNLHGR